MNWNSTSKEDTRKFGVVAFTLFGALCAIGLFKDKALPTYVFGFLSILGGLFILIPFPLRPVHVAWLRMAHFIGTFITMFLLALTYYLVITPAGLLKRLCGGVPLPLKPDKRASSYWVARAEPAQPRERFLKRY
jgi:hypothetical protein